jgi:hypothetical protein
MLHLVIPKAFTLTLKRVKVAGIRKVKVHPITGHEGPEGE